MESINTIKKIKQDKVWNNEGGELGGVILDRKIREGSLGGDDI